MTYPSKLAPAAVATHALQRLLETPDARARTVAGAAGAAAPTASPFFRFTWTNR